MQSKKALEVVQAAFHEAFGVDAASVTLETVPDDVTGWDSLGHTVMVSALEEALDLAIDIDDVMEMESVAKIVRILEEKVA